MAGSDMEWRAKQQIQLFHHFCKALRQGNLLQLQKTVQKDATLIRRTLDDTSYDQALHIAVRCGRRDIVLYLVREYPNTAAMCNRYGETPLYIAINKDQFNLVNDMLSYLGQQPNLNLNLNPEGAKSIVHALLERPCWQENIRVLYAFGHHLGYLLKSQEEGLSLLSWAICNKSEPMALDLLENFPELMDIPDRNVGSGISFPVHQALKKEGRINVLMALYNKDKSSICKQGNNETILHLAARNTNCNPEILNFLKDLPEVHMLLNICDSLGRRPIEVAKKRKNQDFYQLFRG